MTWYQDEARLQAALEEHGSLAAVSRAYGVPRTTLSEWKNKGPGERSDPAVSRLDEAIERERERKPWGLGGPATLDVPGEGDVTVVGLFDLHGEWREQDLLDASLRMIRDLKPDCVVIGGDAVNFDVISRWQDKVLKRMTPLAIYREIKREIEDFERGIMAPIRDAAGDALVVMVEGNHDDRLRKFISDDLEEAWEQAREWMRVDKYLDGYYNRAGVDLKPGPYAYHGEKLSKYPAAAELEATDCTGWSGHGHYASQQASRPKVMSPRHNVHTRFPAMCRRDSNYGAGNAGKQRWHQGCGVGRFSRTNSEDHATDIAWWLDGGLRVWGNRY